MDNLTNNVSWEKTEEYQCMETLVRTTGALGRGKGEGWLGSTGVGDSGAHILCLYPGVVT